MDKRNQANKATKMPRKKKRNPHPNEDSIHENNNNGTFNNNGTNLNMEQAVDKLFLKRADVREEGYKQLVDELKTNFDVEGVAKREDLLTDAIMNSLRKGRTQEITLACCALEMLCLTLGTEGLKVYEVAKPQLIEIARHSQDAAVRTAALEALALCCFIAVSEQAEIRGCFEFISSVFSNTKEDPTVISQALSSWSLLVTILPLSYVNEHILPNYLKVLAKFLEAPDLDVRISTGETLALLCSIHYQVLKDSKQASDFGSYVDFEQLLDTLNELVNDTQKQFSKKRQGKTKASI